MSLSEGIKKELIFHLWHPNIFSQLRANHKLEIRSVRIEEEFLTPLPILLIHYWKKTKRLRSWSFSKGLGATPSWKTLRYLKMLLNWNKLDESLVFSLASMRWGLIRKIKIVVKNEEYFVYLKEEWIFYPIDIYLYICVYTYIIYIIHMYYVYIIYTCISVYAKSVWKDPATVNVMRMICTTSM